MRARLRAGAASNGDMCHNVRQLQPFCGRRRVFSGPRACALASTPMVIGRMDRMGSVGSVDSMDVVDSVDSASRPHQGG